MNETKTATNTKPWRTSVKPELKISLTGNVVSIQNKTKTIVGIIRVPLARINLLTSLSGTTYFTLYAISIRPVIDRQTRRVPLCTLFLIWLFKYNYTCTHAVDTAQMFAEAEKYDFQNSFHVNSHIYILYIEGFECVYDILLFNNL